MKLTTAMLHRPRAPPPACVRPPLSIQRATPRAGYAIAHAVLLH